MGISLASIKLVFNKVATAPYSSQIIPKELVSSLIIHPLNTLVHLKALDFQNKQNKYRSTVMLNFYSSRMRSLLGKEEVKSISYGMKKMTYQLKIAITTHNKVQDWKKVIIALRSYKLWSQNLGHSELKM